MTTLAIQPIVSSSQKRAFGEIEPPSQKNEAPDIKNYFNTVFFCDFRLWKNSAHLEYNSKRYLSYNWSKYHPPLKAETPLEISYLIAKSDTPLPVQNELKGRIKPLVQKLPPIELGRLHKIAAMISGQEGIAMRALLYPHLYHCKPAEVQHIPSHGEVLEQFIEYLVRMQHIPMSKIVALLNNQGLEIPSDLTWESVLSYYKKGQQLFRDGRVEQVFRPYFISEGCHTPEISSLLLPHGVEGLAGKRVKVKSFLRFQIEGSDYKQFFQEAKTSAPLFPLFYAFFQSKLGVYVPKNWLRISLQDFKPLLDAIESLRLECTAGIGQTTTLAALTP